MTENDREMLPVNLVIWPLLSSTVNMHRYTITVHNSPVKVHSTHLILGVPVSFYSPVELNWSVMFNECIAGI